MCKIGSPLLSFLLCSLCTPLQIDLFDQMLVLNKVDNVGRLAFMGTPQEARKYFETDEIKDVYDIMEKNPGKYIFKGDGTNE